MKRFLSLPAQQFPARLAPRQLALPVLSPGATNGIRLAGSSSTPKDAAQSEASSSNGAPTGEPDLAANEEAKGATGGGEPLSSSKNAPPQPKIHNAKVPGKGMDLTDEQREEVEAHNREFEKKHDRAAPAAEDRVDKGFWGGGKTSKGD